MKALNNLVMQFRKICNHPFVFQEVESVINPAQRTDSTIYRVAGKFELLDRILPKYFATGHRILMFFQMTQIMDIMEDYLRWRGYKYLRLDGSVKAEDRGELLKDFNAPESEYFIFLLSTRAGGLGLNLQTADTVIIYDSDWNPHQDLQAQDRAHRIGQTKEVRILRLITSKSIEEHILARAQYKLDLDGKVIQAGKFDNKTSEAEREELLRSLFGEAKLEEDKDEEEEDISMNDEELNEVIARGEEELEVFRRMDLERESKDIEDWQGLGKNSPWNKSRMMVESELPAVYLVDINEVMEQEKADSDAIVHGRGARDRKDVYYDEVLNEEQWTAAVDRGDDVDAIAQGKRNARKRRAGAMGSEDEDDEEAALGRRRSQVSKATMSVKKRKRNVHGIDRDAPDVVQPAMRKAMTRVFMNVYRAVESMDVIYEGEEEPRQRCELFLEVPSRSDYPDYYQVIKKPIAMDVINARINSNYYKTISAFQEDFDLMFSNAMTFNLEGSEVYTDAIEMQNMCHATLKASLMNGQQVVVTDADVKAAEIDARNFNAARSVAARAAPPKKARRSMPKKRRVSDYESDPETEEDDEEDSYARRPNNDLPNIGFL